MVIRKLDVLSVGKITGIIAAAFGLIAGLLLLVFGGLIAGLVGSQGDASPLAALGGVVGAIALPVFYGICGFVGGVLQALIYNIAAGVIGGIRIETE